MLLRTPGKYEDGFQDGLKLYKIISQSERHHVDPVSNSENGLCAVGALITNLVQCVRYIFVRKPRGADLYGMMTRLAADI
jgi:hypothetical protein